MPVDERVAALEARMSEQTQTLAFFRETFARIEQRFTAVDQRFAAVDQRFDAIDRRFDAVDRRFDGVDARLARLEDKMSTQFLWTVGIQITILLAVLGALFARP
ncbi:MAG TPA: hypothetical protein VG871_24370 [Vicinamibacterales bacterium]|nr:hypothetical protein [Vicinamibacterales bacterium]